MCVTGRSGTVHTNKFVACLEISQIDELLNDQVHADHARIIYIMLESCPCVSLDCSQGQIHCLLGNFFRKWRNIDVKLNDKIHADKYSTSQWRRQRVLGIGDQSLDDTDQWPVDVSMTIIMTSNSRHYLYGFFRKCGNIEVFSWAKDLNSATRPSISTSSLIWKCPDFARLDSRIIRLCGGYSTTRRSLSVFALFLWHRKFIN